MMIETAVDSVPSPSANLPVPIGRPRAAVVPITPPGRPTHYNACRLVGEIANEMSVVISGRVQYRRDRRRRMAHVRQIAMYVCHVSLQIQPCDIAQAFGRDAATVRYACHIVEDRRDDGAYDDFVSSIERMVVAVFSAWEDVSHG